MLLFIQTFVKYSNLQNIYKVFTKFSTTSYAHMSWSDIFWWNPGPTQDPTAHDAIIMV